MHKRWMGLGALLAVFTLVAAGCSKSNEGGGGSGSPTPTAITSWEQLKSGDTVGVQSGTTGEFWAKENLEPKGVSIRGWSKAPDIFNALEAGQIVAAVVDLPTAQDIVKTKPDLTVAQQIETGEKYGYAVNKANTSLLDAINAAMSKLFADGTYTTIFKKYFPTQQMPSYVTSPSGATPSPGCPQLTTLKPGILTLGSDIPYPPWEYNKGGTLTGFDVEFMDAIAKQLCLTPSWVDTGFTTIFTSLAANRFDAVASSVTAYAPPGSAIAKVVAHRAEIVAFTEPYYDSLQSLTVKKTGA